MNLIIPKSVASVNVSDTSRINSTSFLTITEHNISYELSTETLTWSKDYRHVHDMNYSSENSSIPFPDYFYYISSMEYPLDIYKDVPLWEFVLKIVLYTIIIVASLVGNFLVIVVVLKNKRMQTATNFYIVNLAVADILVTVACSWVQLVNNLTNGWILGTFFCKFNSFAQEIVVRRPIIVLKKSYLFISAGKHQLYLHLSNCTKVQLNG
ncbi:hypothetical protein CHS0354_028222 [Potamilus streckersoni]|uniref:G-protein coupled receptors family 1 profile domain-containing protein n=1 Tax=Potamilus streckersoni TaxID=2493646 RepID=A0AAE0RTT9_9BIVA|nr:hypothetical protein CHS0354_028222 [Potamilus streckersoni]